MSYWNLKESERQQLAMYNQLIDIVKKHNFVVLNINENNDGAEIIINMSKKGKSILTLSNESNSDDYYR